MLYIYPLLFTIYQKFPSPTKEAVNIFLATGGFKRLQKEIEVLAEIVNLVLHIFKTTFNTFSRFWGEMNISNIKRL